MRRVRLAAATLASTLALSLACGLVGCGASQSAGEQGGTEEAVEEAATDAVEEAEKEAEEEAEKERALHWYMSSQLSKSSYGFYSSDDNVETNDYRYNSTIERDDAGNVLKKTEKSVSKGSYGSTTTETVTEYTYDEQGWPLTKKETETITSVFDGETHTDEPKVTEAEFTYEYDDEGRVVSAHSTLESDEQLDGVTYHENGEVAGYTTTMVDEWGEEKTTYTSTVELFEDGDLKRSLFVTTNGEGEETSREETVYDEDGNIVSESENTSKEDESTGKSSHELEHDAKGNVTKDTTTVEGDGETANTRWIDGSQDEVFEIFMPDGSIQAAPMTYDEEYNEVPGEYETYEGPYSVEEMTYRKDGKLRTSKKTYYDGTSVSNEYRYRDGKVIKQIRSFSDGSVETIRYRYDEDGNTTKVKTTVEGRVVGGLGSLNKQDWVYVEEPSEYVKQFQSVLYW